MRNEELGMRNEESAGRDSIVAYYGYNVKLQ